MTIHLVLADDHPIVLDGLASLFALEPDFAVQASCTSGAQALHAVMEHRPDVLLLDICLPDFSGIEVLRRMREDGYLKALAGFTTLAEVNRVAAFDSA